jgi:hypothetical protein
VGLPLLLCVAATEKDSRGVVWLKKITLAVVVLGAFF